MDLGIIGHTKSISLAQALIEKKSRSYFFVGQTGIGKKTVATALIRSLLCLETGSEECQCQSCSLFEKRTHPDFKYLVRDGKYFKIEQIHLLQKECSRRPKIGQYKAFLIAETDKMTSRAANALLKTLEEPPDYVFIFLIAQDANLVLPTIKSRCSVIKFKPLTEDAVKQVLEHKDFYGDLELASKLSFGSVRKAISCISGTALDVRDRALQLLVELSDYHIYRIFELGDSGVDALFVDFLQLLVYDLLAIKKEGTLKNIDRAEELQNLASKYTQEFLVQAIRRLVSFKNRSWFNINFPLHFSQLILELKALNSKYKAVC